jgi:hypothetical protein
MGVGFGFIGGIGVVITASLIVRLVGTAACGRIRLRHRLCRGTGCSVLLAATGDQNATDSEGKAHDQPVRL